MKTDPKVLDPAREIRLEPVTVHTRRRKEGTAVLSTRRARSLSIQDVRNLTMESVYKYAPAAMEMLCLQAIGEHEMSNNQLKACQLLMDRLLPRLQGIAVQTDIQKNVTYTWKDKPNKANHTDDQ